METMEMTTAAAAAGKPGYKLTKLGWIPEEWDITTLADIVDPERNITYGIVQAGPHVEDGVPYIKTGDLSAEIVPDTLSRTSHEIAQQYSRSEVYPGDIVFSLRGDVGASRIVPAELLVANLTQGTARIAVPGDSDRDFVFQQICSPDVAKRLLDQAKGSTFQEITLKALRLFTIVWPPERERIAIAEVLTSFDKATRNLSKLLIAKRTYKRGLMQQLLTGQRRFPEFQGQPWREVKLGSILQEVTRDIVWDDEELYNLVSVRRRSGGLYFRESLFGRQILTKTLKDVHAGDFLISKMQVVHGALGLATKEFEGMKVSGSYISLVSKDEGELLIEYFNFLSQLPELYNKALLASHGVHIEKMTFNIRDYFKHSVLIPPTIQEQRKIVQTIELLNQETELLQDQLRQWQQQKKGLMQQLLTGQLRVPTV
jgi:type I restriction enzyme S subunit